MVPLEYAYLFGDAVFLIVWVVLYVLRPDVRREMTVMSLIIGVVSVLSAYFWWTHDWWHPLTITGTRVGIEDFIMGFGSGGIMTAAYEVIFKKYYVRRKPDHHHLGAGTILIMLALFTFWFIGVVGLTSFWASTLALVITASVLMFFRKDLFLNSLISGILMALISLLFYFSTILVSPAWIAQTYFFHHLSGVLVCGIPIEELVFWFLAGAVFGPFYEYWQCEYCKKPISRRKKR